MQQKKPSTNKNKWIFASAVLAAILLFVLIAPYLGILPSYSEIFEDTGMVDGIDTDNEMSVHFIDVGQGDCILILSPDGNVLIDAGERGNEETVLNYLADYSVTKLDYVIATHPHSDHIGSLPEVIDAMQVANVIMPRLTEINTPTTVIYEKLLTSVKNSGAKVIAAAPGKSYSLGKMTFTVLSPSQQDSDLNNMSVVTLFEYEGKRFLFEGDAEQEAEELILDSGFDISADVIKLGHHGSSTSSSPAYLDAVLPRYAVIMCGKDNSYGHPHRETLEYLEENYISLYRTDRLGTVVFEVENGKINVLNGGVSE